MDTFVPGSPRKVTAALPEATAPELVVTDAGTDGTVFVDGGADEIAGAGCAVSLVGTDVVAGGATAVAIVAGIVGDGKGRAASVGAELPFARQAAKPPTASRTAAPSKAKENPRFPPMPGAVVVSNARTGVSSGRVAIVSSFSAPGLSGRTNFPRRTVGMSLC
jgi:hypothetical protein